MKIDKWMELEYILSDITQTLIDKCFMFSLICGFLQQTLTFLVLLGVLEKSIEKDHWCEG